MAHFVVFLEFSPSPREFYCASGLVCPPFDLINEEQGSYAIAPIDLREETDLYAAFPLFLSAAGMPRWIQI